ncbi:MAG: FtsH-binding integral membrane protein, partial [Candidatus Paceibacteria bacterium]
MEITQKIDFNTSEGLRSFFGKIYGKMARGVLLTAIVSFGLVYTAPGNELLQMVFSSQIIYYGVIGIELALLFGIQWGINKLSKQWAEYLFYLYAGLSGVTLSVILLAYTGATLVSTFVAAVAIFAALAAVGKNMKYDMSGWKVFLFTGMWGVFIASIANIFLQSSRIDWIVTIIAVLVFAGLTVYQSQSYKRM